MGPRERLWPASRAAATMLVALLVLWRMDQLGLSSAVTFGAFCGIYGGAEPRFGRWREQAAAGGVLLGAVVTGTLVATQHSRAWWAIAVAALWAVVAAALSKRGRWRPAGPMFAVFAAATSASIPATGARVGQATLACAATALFAISLAAVEVWLLAPRGPAAPPQLPPYPAHRRRVHTLRCGAAVIVAGLASTIGGIGHPYWAMVASVVPLTVVGLRHQLLRAAQRAIGTFVGLGVAAVVLWTGPDPPTSIILAALCQGITELLVVRHYGVALVFVTPLALIIGQLARPLPTGTLVGDRLIETCLGVAVGAATAWITRDRSVEAETRVGRRTG